MTDHIPADKLRKAREWVEHASETMGELPAHAFGAHAGFHAAVDVIMSLPEPALPTLADMTPEEREKCQWMQARLDGETESVVIANLRSERVWVMWDDGLFDLQTYDKVTPLPGEPKLKWPGSHADTITTESVEDVQAGRVADFEPDLPRPEDVPAGEPWIVRHEGEEWTGLRADYPDQPWSIISMDGLDHRDVSDLAITIVSRLVPETPRKTLVTVEDYRDAPARWICLDETADDEGVFHKLEGPLWMDGMGYTHSPEDMAGTPRTVIWEPAS